MFMDEVAINSGLNKQQEERKHRFFEKYVEVLELLPEDFEIDSRSMVWNALAYFHSDYNEKANDILRRVELHRCHFMPMQMLEIFHMFGKKIDRDVREKMTNYILESVEYMKSEKFHISMYNDNFSNMSTYTLIVAGEYFGKKELLELGKSRLEEVCEMFGRSGVIMEYCSPTYTPIDTLCFAQMVNHVKDSKIKEMALKCEERMWLEITTHYHPETSMLAGPHSRVYGADSIGHPGLISGLLWKVLGDEVFINPLVDCFPLHINQVVHISREKLMLPNLAWIIGVTYHCPENLKKLALHKTYPYRVSCRTECLPANILAGSTREGIAPEEYGHCSCGQGHIKTYMTEEYAMGTAETTFHSGALSNGFYLQYRLCDSADKLQDTAVVYSRYLCNDHLPDQDNTYEVYGTAAKSSFRDEGLKFGSQKDNVSVVLYHPITLEREHVNSARLALMIPCYFYQDYEIWVGDKQVKNYSYKGDSLKTVYIHAGNVYFSFVPLTTTDLGRDCAMSIEIKNHHLMISFYNYHGKVKSFSSRELMLAQAGFVCICGTSKEHSDMKSFRQYVNQGELIEDRMEVQERASCRRLRYRHSGKEFRMIFNPEGKNFVVNTINGRPIDQHIIKADNIKNSQIPFLEYTEKISE